jgi:SRSO17 transposase
MGWGLRPPVIVADAGYGEIGAFRAGLEDRELRYVVQVKASTSAHPAGAQREQPAYQGRGRPRARCASSSPPDSPQPLTDVAIATQVPRKRKNS